MNPELDPTMLAELRALHQSERATAELERRVLVRLLPSRGKAPLGARVRAWRSRAPSGRTALGATLGMAAAGALYLGSGAFSVKPSHVPGPEPRLEAAGDARKAAECPLDGLPPELAYEPTRMEPEAARAGLQLDTFAMPIPGCPALVRRTLSYVPRTPVRSRCPVLLVLHDGGDSAQGVRALQTGDSFEKLAERHGLLVVYANAAPAPGRFLHSGVWQLDPGANRAIDDFAYLARVVERLGARWPLEQGGSGPDVYLIGYGSGAHLALEAAAQHPERYVGVAAVLPDEVNGPRPPPYRSDTRLSRLLFVTPEDARPGAYWAGAPLKLDEWQVTVGLQYLVQQRTKLVLPREDQAPGPLTSEEEASLLARRVVPAGTRVFDSWFPDKGAPGWRVVVVPSKAAIEVGAGGSPAPVDAATLAWEFFQRNVPGYVGAAGP